MGRTDKLKEEIGWLKVIFAISIATDISLFAWLIENFRTATPSFVIVGVIGAVLITVAIIWINSVAYRKINQLEEP